MRSTKSTKSTTSTRKKSITEAIGSFARRGSNATARVATRAATRAATGLRNMFGIRPATAPVITVEMHDLPVAPAPDRPQSVRRNRDATPAALPVAAAHATAPSRARSVPHDRTDVDAALERIKSIRAQIDKILKDSKNKPIVNIVRTELDRLSELSQQRASAMRIIKGCNIGIPTYKKERDIGKLEGAKALLLENKTKLKNIQSELGVLQSRFYGPDSIERLKRRLQNNDHIKQTAGSTRKRRKHKKK